MRVPVNFACLGMMVTCTCNNATGNKAPPPKKEGGLSALKAAFGVEGPWSVAAGRCLVTGRNAWPCAADGPDRRGDFNLKGRTVS